MIIKTASAISTASDYWMATTSKCSTIPRAVLASWQSAWPILKRWSFHQHFKAITSTTPLQYQKELRLLEARSLLKKGGASVTTTAFEVGYESSSQFSREYARKFGLPPSQDVPSGAE